MGGAERMGGSVGYGAFWGWRDGGLDGGELAQDGFGARQKGRGFVEENSAAEVA